MALWKVNGELVYSDGALSITPTGPGGVFVQRHFYEVPYTNVGKGGFIMKDGKKIHTPSWMEVHPGTTQDDIVVKKKPFQELFVEEEKHEFKSATSDKTYIVRRNKNGDWSCDCWGYIGHKKCKHVKKVSETVGS
jgi:hypothetical protein